jgi:hypothetical protein
MRTTLCLQLSFACLLALTACGGDDDEPAATPDASVMDGGDSSAAGSGGKGTGSGKEGVECKAHSECASGLSCLKADQLVTDLKVCARPCDNDDGCEGDEVCKTITGEPSEAFCWNIEGEALALCGPGQTAMCDAEKNLGCLRIEDDERSVANGVCLSPCELGKDDACSVGFACLDIIDQDDAGLCAKTVARGEVCDEPKGRFCEPGNLCLDDGSDWRCYQDCSESSSCDDEKECKDLSEDQGAYCE